MSQSETGEIDRSEAKEASASRPASSGRLGRFSLYSVLAIVALVVLYYVGGMIYLHKIDDDPSFGIETSVPEGGSRAVAMAIGLIEREVDQNRWVANDPMFQPSYFLDNMPNFQQGIVQALGRFAFELNDQIARVRGSSQADTDLESAVGRLNYPGDVWILEWSGTPVQPSSESQYRRALEDLTRYNERLARGEAVFDRRADNLLQTLDRIAADIGALSANSFDHMSGASGFGLDFQADDIFYRNKGRIYAYFLILRELGQDYSGVLAERRIAEPWQQMLESLEIAATLYPWVVTNGSLDGMTVPNHLANQGFFIIRARTQLREVTAILQR